LRPRLYAATRFAGSGSTTSVSTQLLRRFQIKYKRLHATASQVRLCAFAEKILRFHEFKK
jgi:hypothetical protein